MDLRITDEQRERAARVREIVDRELLPLEERFLTEPWEEVASAVEAVRDTVRSAGLWAPQLPAELGGMGLGLVGYSLVSEILGRSPLGHYAFGCNAPDAGNAELLMLHGSEQQRRRWLKPLAAGEIRSCFSMTEPDMPGSNPTMLATRAVLDDDEWVIDGQKWYTTGAEGAAFAIVMAVTDPEAPRHRRASMILVPTDTAGFEPVRNLSVMGHRGSGVFSHAEIRYRDCRVPRENLVGPRGEGFVLAQERLAPGRIHHVTRWLGIAERSFDLLCERVVEREVAPGRLLADREVIQTWVAECRAELEAARWLTLSTAWTVETDGWRAARRPIAMIKFLVANTMLAVVDRAIQAHGGLGVTDDTVLAFFYRQERPARIYDGPDEVHKLWLGRNILADYRTEQGRIEE